MKIKVILADSHPAVSEGLLSVLKAFPMITVMRIVSNAKELMSALEKTSFDVLVTEYTLENNRYASEIELLETIREKYPKLNIVLQTIMDNPPTLGRIMAMGVSSIISKCDKINNVISAILAAYSAGRYLSPHILRSLQKIENKNRFGAINQSLSRCEAEVLELYMKGKTVTEIAEEKKRSIKTISSQKSSAMKKLGIGREIDLYRYIKNGELPLHH